MKLAMLISSSLALAACGTSPDSRPATFEVVTEEVLKPSCGLVACHSSTTNESGYAFDTLAAARATFVDQGTNEIHEKITEKEMPPDSPMAEADIQLFEAWLSAGKPGL